MGTNALTFLHLSDIHFDAASGDKLDMNRDLRNQLKRDILSELKPKLGTFNGVFVTGDIAYSGSVEEYNKAIDWLEEVCKIIGCKDHKVWVVPGNHDVERLKVKNSKPLCDIHERFRKTPVGKIDEEFVSTLRDETYKSILFKPIENYIKFASKFECVIKPEEPFWETKGMTMNDGSLLCFRGLTSTIVSDEKDHHDTAKLVLGCPQVQISQEPSKTYVTLCHHPLDWLHDCDSVLKYLTSRAHVSLFGHKHKQWIEQRGTGENTTLFIVAGAVHPERGCEWQPRYNAISFEVVEYDRCRSLKVQVYSRVWNKDATSFQADRSKNGTEYFEYLIPLSAWIAPKDQHDLGCDIEEKDIQLDQSNIMQIEQGGTSQHLQKIGQREFTYKFLSLPYHEIVSIGVTLELIEDEDESAADFELVRRFCKRALAHGKISNLIEMVITKYSKQKGDT